MSDENLNLKRAEDLSAEITRLSAELGRVLSHQYPQGEPNYEYLATRGISERLAKDAIRLHMNPPQ